MPNRIRLIGFALALLVMSRPTRGANPDGSTPEVGNVEAARLYREANDFVSDMSEGDYSYSYLQFYWKRAQSDIDRIRRVYAGSPTAQALGRGELKLGPYDPEYFKERVLYNLELKRLGAADDVNCAIFLYGRDPFRSDAIRDSALSDIIEVLARRQRWGEALRFPVLSAHKHILWSSLYRIAITYEVPDMVKQIYKLTTPYDRKVAGFDSIHAEAIALQADPKVSLVEFVTAHPDNDVRIAALKGLIERDSLIRHAEMTHARVLDTIQTIHLVARHIKKRDDVRAVAAELFREDPEAAAPLLAVYDASRGVAPSEEAPLDAHLAYLRYLADSDNWPAVDAYCSDAHLSGDALGAAQLKVIELYAEAGRDPDAERARLAYGKQGEAAANQAALAQFRGRMDSTEEQLVAKTKTFADIPITDPCVLAIAIMDWSLTPNREQRGASPWDAAVAKFAGGFKNLPKPASTEVGDAASTLKPY